MIFTLDEDELSRYHQWEAAHDLTCRFAKVENTGAIGGRITFSFTSTSLGTIVRVKCGCGAEEDLTDYKLW